MLNPWVIDEIGREEEKRKRSEQRPIVQIDDERSPESDNHEEPLPDDRESIPGGNVVKIDLL